MTQRIVTTRTTRTDPLPPRWQRLVTLLQSRPRLTAQEIGEALGIDTKTARTYLSEVARVLSIRAEGPVGSTRYFLGDDQEQPFSAVQRLALQLTMHLDELRTDELQALAEEITKTIAARAIGWR